MRAEEEQHDWYSQQKLLRWCILIAIIDLFPHIQIVISSAVELEWYSPHPMEHQIGAGHVCDVRERPRRLLRNAWNYVEENLQGNDDYDVNGPCACIYIESANASVEGTLARLYKSRTWDIEHVAARRPLLGWSDSPLEFTHSAFKLGKAD